jgi:hypothetical protein
VIAYKMRISSKLPAEYQQNGQNKQDEIYNRRKKMVDRDNKTAYTRIKTDETDSNTD